jgi:hypothetical protein
MLIYKSDRNLSGNSPVWRHNLLDEKNRWQAAFSRGASDLEKPNRQEMTEDVPGYLGGAQRQPEVARSRFRAPNVRHAART